MSAISSTEKDCLAAAHEAQKANNLGGPGAQFRFLCVKASNGTAGAPPS
jgi:hypothetical protein